MPLFNTNLPTPLGNLAKARKNKIKLPVGTIGESNNFSYGFNGEYYYVTEGILEYYVTKIHLKFDEAKQLFDSLNFIDAVEPSPKTVAVAIRSARKSRLKGANLFWHFVDTID